MDCKQYDEQLSKLLNDEEEISFFCKLISEDLWHNYNARKELIDYVIDFCENNALGEALAWMYYYLALHNVEFSNYKTAIELHKISKDIFMSSGNKSGIAHNYNGLLGIYCKNGQSELANEVAISAMSIARDLADATIMLKLLLNTAINYISSGSNEDAKNILDYIAKSYDYDSLNLLDKIIYNKSLAQVEINLGNFDVAHEALIRAIEVNSKNEANLTSSELRKIYALYYFKTGRILEAEFEFFHSYSLASKNNHLFEKCETLIEWAEFKFNYNADNYAVSLLKKALKISEKNNFKKLIKNSSMLLYSYFNKNKKFKEALFYLELYLKANKEIQEYNNTNYIGKIYSNSSGEETNLYKILHDKTEILFSIGQKIISTLDVKEMMLRVFKDISKLVDVDFFTITVYNSDLDEMVVNRIENEDLVVTKPIKLSTSSSFTAYCIKNKKSIIINDIMTEYNKYVNKIEYEGRGVDKPISNVFLPIMYKDIILGVLSVQSLKANAYDADDINRLRVISNYIAISLKNAIQYQKMEKVAVYDSLTGFLTKRELIKLGNIQIEKFKNSLSPFSILMIDIDDFKIINDTYGHFVGDKVLKMITSTIKKQIRATDFIGRYGGDEFVLICPNTKLDVANKIAKRIEDAVDNNKFVVNEDTSVSISLSIGVFEFNDENMTLFNGIDVADSRMYSDKNSKK
jgi:diguanylate cyclase (GGDEF)-like protein